MKRKLMGLLCICLMLSGCRNSPQPPVETEPLATEAPTVQTTVSLLEQGNADGNLIRISNETVEAMEQPEMRLLGNGLLLEIVGDERFPLQGRQFLLDHPLDPFQLHFPGQANALIAFIQYISHCGNTPCRNNVR